MLSLQAIQAARERIQPHIYMSPCARADRLSDRFGCELFLKLENLQITGSFKERGASNYLALLAEADKSRGIIAPSAGNHAQALAYHSRRLGVRAKIVMPTTTPLIKVSETSRLGAEVVLEGGSYQEAYEAALRWSEEEALNFVHPFDDPAVIAGQGTVGLEILEQVPDVDVVVCCVGGGGLLAGTLLALKEQRPEVQVLGVEPAAMPSLARAYESGRPILVERRKTIADGAAVARVGAHTFEVIDRYADGVAAVDEEQIAEAILLLLEFEKTVAEGAGSLGVAALSGQRLSFPGKRVVAIISGGNIDANVVAKVIDRGLVKTGRKLPLKVQLNDVPGSLAALLSVIGEQGANVLQIQHDRVASKLALDQATVEIQLETRSFTHIQQVRDALDAEGYRVVA